MADESRRVLVAGGGPVGLLCAWLLGQQGIPVRLFDVNDSPQADPRAATTHPASFALRHGTRGSRAQSQIAPRLRRRRAAGDQLTT